MADKIRYAVIGLGWITQQAFLPGIKNTNNSEIVAFVTGDAEKGRILGSKYGVTHIYNYDNYLDLLDKNKVDAVYLALPNSMHHEFAVSVLRSGYHLLLEKPMARNEEECLAIIRAADGNRKKLMIAYRLHFEPATLAAIELVRSGKLGDPRLFSAVFTQHLADGNHRKDNQYWAGPLPDMGVYPINAARNLFGDEPIEALAIKAHGQEYKNNAVPEMISVILRFPKERLAQFTISYGVSMVDQYRIMATHGSLEVSPGFMFGTALKHKLVLSENQSEESAFSETDQFAGEIQYFSNCILKDQQPEPDGYEGLADIRVVHAIEQSLKTRHAEPIKYTERKLYPSSDQVFKLPPSKPLELVHATAPNKK